MLNEISVESMECINKGTEEEKMTLSVHWG